MNRTPTASTDTHRASNNGTSKLTGVLSLIVMYLLFLGGNHVHAQTNSLPLPTNPFAAQTEEFLHVDEAYQLSVRQTEQDIIIQWVIAEAYFLYGEQFRFSVDGQSVDATRPAGEISYDAIFEKDVEKYYVFTESVISKSTLPKTNNPTINLSVTYQGCADAGLCYPPETKVFTVNVEQLTATEHTTPSTSAEQNTATPSSTNTTFSITTMVWMLGIAIIGGALLNLMPCVFPILSIKALAFANNPDSHSRIAHGWSYTLGCIISFVTMAVALIIFRESGKAVGWGFQLQSPGMISFLTLLFFMMGLSLSGLLNIGSRWMNTGQSLTQGQGKKHSFFTGVLATVVASPCTAPFMATALGYALTQSSWVALIIFAGLGLGMSLPFLLLSYSPQLSRRLPAPGSWMNTFKQAIAFPLYLTCVWLLWVLSQQVGNEAIILTLIGAVTITFLSWLSHIKSSLAPINLFATLLICSAIIWHNQQQASIENANTNTVWQRYSPETLANLRSQQQAVFVNLTADWCITCKWNEKRVLTPAMLEKMKNKRIHLLEGDWTTYNADITALLDEYGRGGVPLYLLFMPDDTPKAIVLPQILNATDFEQLIDSI